MKVWERRLMKDFKVAPITSEETDELFASPPDNETSLARYVTFVKEYFKFLGLKFPENRFFVLLS